MRNKSIISVIYVCLAVFLIALSGCATKPTKPAPIGPVPDPTEPPPPYTEVPPQDESVGQTTSGESQTEAPSTRKPSVAVVLGGAGVSSWATVGILKRLNKSDVRVACIVSSGWPTLFALGFGFFKSIHDLEWFAVRIQQENLYPSGFLDWNRGYRDHTELKKLVRKAFRAKKDICQSRTPMFISVSNPETATEEIYSKGSWEAPLLKSMSIPGVYRAYSSSGRPGIFSLAGLGTVDERCKSADHVIAFEMYADYLDHLESTAKQKKNSESLFRQVFVSQFRQNLNEKLKALKYHSSIRLNAKPNDFSKKRSALLLGYQEADNLIRKLRQENLP